MEAQVWWTGPPADRRRYEVADPESVSGGRNEVVRATAVADGERVEVALKVLADADRRHEVVLRDRWARLALHPHPGLAAPLEVFRGPGLFTGEPPPAAECDLLLCSARWVEGRPLREAGPLSLDAVVRLATDLAAAVEHLHHRCGFLHRDLHPGNVVLGPGGEAVLIDFGAARPDDGDVTTTVAGAIGFIAPERTSGPGDRRTDRWGVAMVVAYALLGHPQGTTPTARLRRELVVAADDARDPAGVADLVLALVDPDPEARPTDLRRWADELAAAVRGKGPIPGRRRWAVVAVGAAAVLLAGAAVAATTGGDGAPSAGTEALVATEDTPAPAPASSGVASEPGVRGADGSCLFDFGAPTGQVPPDDDDALSTAELAAAAVGAPLLEAGADGACPTGEPDVYVDAVLQPIEGSRVVMASPPLVGRPLEPATAVTVTLTAAQLESYRQLAGSTNALQVPVYAGYPTGTGELAGFPTVELSGSGVIVGPRADAIAYWMPDQVLARWQAEGGAAGPLGLPTTSTRYVAERQLLYQDFEHGFMTTPVPTPEDLVPSLTNPDVVITVTVVDDTLAALEGADPEGRILSDRNGASWFVEDGERHWIPDTDTYFCLGGEENRVAEDLRGWVAATFPMGAPATCP